MNHIEFNKLLKEILDRTTNVLASKSAEYSTDTDKLHNFKRAGIIANESPEKALWGMALKHLVSIMDIIEKIDSKAQYPSNKILEEKCGDLINYIILLEALIKEDSNEKMS